MSNELRLALEDVPSAPNGEQGNIIEELRSKYHHSVIAIDSTEVFPEGLNTYNCYAYALNLIGLDGYICIATTNPNNVFANSECVIYLLAHEHLVAVDVSGNVKMTHPGN